MILLTPREAGVELARLRQRAKPFNATYIRKLIRLKKLPCQLIGKNYGITLADLEDFAKKHVAKDARSTCYYK